ncbi:MMPL family transporter [Prauserella flavalba]|uniref:Transporter n=1 Tax=Prauserella flavalba TaxID=1477506 RepID=A0A318LSB0_9PSEU|nr:MMPL family transporter [Prauserella flavalba]PXY37613.1 transporter [Prauserella flavalba]
MAGAAQAGPLERLGRGCARHPWPVLLVWLAVLAGATVGKVMVGDAYSDDYTLSDTESGQGSEVLVQHGVTHSANSARIVFESGSLTAHRDAVEQAIGDVREVDHVLAASDPFAQGATSRNGQVAFSTVQFDADPGTIGTGLVDDMDTATDPVRSAGVSVDYGGSLGQAAEPETGDRRSEAIGIGVAVVVLLLAFGSVFAAGLPIVTSVAGVLTGVGLLGLLASQVQFATTAPTLAIMIGLGVGIDYALFLATRHRQLLMDGVDPVTAAGRTVSGSGRSVLIAGTTVVIALLGLFAVGVGFIGKLGLAAAITVLTAAATAVTLVPALLGLAGRRIDRLHVRRPVAEASERGSADAWQRYAGGLLRHPWLALCGGVVVAGVLAIPAFSMQLGHIDQGADAEGSTTRLAYDAIARGFGPGANGQFTVVVQGADGNVAQRLQQALSNTRGVAAATTPTQSKDGTLIVSTVTPTSAPQDSATDDLLHRLRDQTLPGVIGGTNAHSYVTGATAGQLDFRDIAAARLPTIIGVVVGAAFLLLLLTFRSPVLALKAAVLNLLSIAAAYGVIVAVFQWGWGGSFFGVAEPVPIESYVPMIMFAIVFGLSMDYEVFLLSRVHEAWRRSGDSHASVVTGLAVTARVISSAALIMMSVFFAFLLSDSVVIKMLALGLGVSVLIDATLIRLVIVPAAMFLLGDRCWWLPARLDRVLPHLEPEPESKERPSPRRTTAPT